MDHEDALREAAHRADQAAWETMQAYEDGTVDYEPGITGGLAAALRVALNGRIHGLNWSAHVMKTARGVGSEENNTGADLLIHVRLVTETLNYSKGVLVQAKRLEPGASMTQPRYDELAGQCHDMSTSRRHRSCLTMQGDRCDAYLHPALSNPTLETYMINARGLPIDFFSSFFAALLATRG